MPNEPLLQIGTITDRMADALDAKFDRTVLFDQPDRAAFLRDRGADFRAILTDGHWGVPADVAATTPNLKVVSSYGVGYDAIDAPSFAERGILIAHTPNVLNDEVAVTAVMLWLAVYRGLVPADAHARSGAWEEKGFPLTRSPMDRRVGILGMGRIGETIAQMVQAFRAEVHYHSRSEKDVPYAYHATPEALAEAVDVLIVITPGGPETKHLVDADVLKALGKGGTLINVSRGSVVDEGALIDALQDGTIAGAGLDVFEQEPKIPQALKDMPERVVLTPHVGSATMETRQAMGDLVVRNLTRWLDDGTVETPVPECRSLNG
ncbi:2-hydroxyacid dehydrogenase [Jannaschia sp. Os4]|uniref:2-hydroxyacid dehydrogenase n=1 Tax=Jannaschia sp. Os4 TaxID=2807617 RepID=UPI00193A5F00|nr:2-hydroxyacid dehydrogenase [Jannaschia sp. Os4]MBM2577852.1 2-hydroxyacid dehydrogenase [Jannaschia sp. Os4]